MGPIREALHSLLNPLPNWLRWLLVLPAAVVGDLIGQEIGILVTFLAGVKGPFTDALVWHTYAPIMFVALGLQLAPAYRIQTCIVLSAVKIGVLSYNSYSALQFVIDGGSWTTVYPVTDSPLWWNLMAYILGVAALITLTLFVVQAERRRNRRDFTAAADQRVV